MAKPIGWFSRKHASNEAHQRDKIRRASDLESHFALRDSVAAARAKRSPAEQLNLLDEVLGKDVGAKKERARLHKQVAIAKENDRINKKQMEQSKNKKK